MISTIVISTLKGIRKIYLIFRMGKYRYNKNI